VPALTSLQNPEELELQDVRLPTSIPRCRMETRSLRLTRGFLLAHSGLIVAPEYRGQGLAKKIKKEVFNLSLQKYPEAKVFGITTGMAVMKINYQLGYKPVHFSELTDDPEFWKGCQTCKNYDVLTRTERKMCLCTGMLYDPKDDSPAKKINSKVFSRLKKIKESLLFKKKNA
jgi:GNAT superfamily N-acetyltransferase